jgi:hypothetical protein
MRWTPVLVMAIISVACKPTRIVKVGWDVPASLPDGYWVLVDDRTVLDIKPPRVDPSCSCLTVEVRVPRGRHTVTVIAHDRGGASRPSATVVVQ